MKDFEVRRCLSVFTLKDGIIWSSAFLAKLLGLHEDEIEPDQLNSSGRGWRFVFEMLPKALRRFYNKCAVGGDWDR